MFRICSEFSVMFRICSEFSVMFRIFSEFLVIFRHVSEYLAQKLVYSESLGFVVIPSILLIFGNPLIWDSFFNSTCTCI